MKAYCPNCLAQIAQATIAACPSCNSPSERPGGGWPNDPLLGQQVRDYRVEKLIGIGGFGNVYEVRHVLLNDRVFAMKALRTHLSADPRTHQDFLDEIKLLMSFDHPHIVKCHELGRLEDNSLFVLMERIYGRKLGQVIEEEGPLPPVQIATIGSQIASALMAAHARGVLHRDLKTDNILLGDDDQVRVIDFGIAKSLGPNTSGKALSRLVGTPMFMAPEQFNPGQPIDGRLDIYQLGALMHMLATNEPPYQSTASSLDDYLDDIARQQKSGYGLPGPRPSRHRPALASHPIGRELDGLIGQMLSTDRSMRPPSAEKVFQFLTDVLNPTTQPVPFKTASPKGMDTLPAQNPNSPIDSGNFDPNATFSRKDLKHHLITPNPSRNITPPSPIPALAVDPLGPTVEIDPDALSQISKQVAEAEAAHEKVMVPEAATSVRHEPSTNKDNSKPQPFPDPLMAMPAASLTTQPSRPEVSQERATPTFDAVQPNTPSAKVERSAVWWFVVAGFVIFVLGGFGAIALIGLWFWSL